MSGRLTVLLVDDHAVVREGYRRLLEDSGRISVVGEASNAADAYQQFCRLMPGVVVMDIALPGVSGIEGTRRILAHEPSARVLVFSMYEEAIFVRRALDAGAAGYLTKASAPHVLIEAIDVVASGRRFLSPDVAQALVGLGLDLAKLNTVGDLQGGIEEAERLLGYRTVRDAERASPGPA